MFGRPLISLHPWPVRWTGTEADQALWRSQSSVTDKAIMLLLCALKAVIKCDRDCPAAAPTGRQWGVHQQPIMTGEAEGGSTHEIIARFRFGCKNLPTSCRAGKKIMLVSAGQNLARCEMDRAAFRWYMTHVATECLHYLGLQKENWHFSVWYMISCVCCAAGNRCNEFELTHVSLH